jgi:hypothetical protein
MHFRNSSLVAYAIAKHSCNIGVNDTEVFVFNSDSEEEFKLSD